MTNPNGADEAPDSFSDLPLQPTGSGVADLEIAYEQMKVAAGDGAAAVRAAGEMDSLSTGAGDGEAWREGRSS